MNIPGAQPNGLHPIQYGTKPGDSCAQILGTHRATHVSSCGRTWVAPSLSSKGPHGDLRLKDADWIMEGVT